jgi:hypothetical protein
LVFVYGFTIPIIGHMTSVTKLPKHIPKPLTTPPPGLKDASALIKDASALINKDILSPSGSSSKILSRLQRRQAWGDPYGKKSEVTKEVTNVQKIRQRVKTPRGKEYAEVVAAAAAGRRSAVVGGKRKTRKNK